MKKENLRIQLIRGHHRAIKNALQGKTPAKTLNKINQKQFGEWKIFKAHTEKRFSLKDYLNGYNLMDCKSFNNNICYKYFSDHDTRKSFGLYCNVIFCGEGPKELCEKFKIKCCERGNRHDYRCKLEWVGMEKFIRCQMISELGIKNK